MSEYQVINKQEDVVHFRESCNCLHDGHITSVDYRGAVLCDNNCVQYKIENTCLILRVLVTSMCGTPTVELKFTGVFAWQVKHNFDSIFDFTVTFDEHENIIWNTEFSADGSFCRDGTYVYASEMQWRIIVD